MNKHDFIFKEGIWLGEGEVIFTSSPEKIHFFTKWVVKKSDNGEVQCRQQVEMRGGGDPVTNDFTFSKIDDSHFTIKLENEILGTSSGKGIIDDKSIAWEFKEHSDFEGFEVYELQENGNYLLHAEYISTDQHRTTIDGHIWKKIS